MRVLITGAEGQVGRELVDAFSRPGLHQVVPCSRETLDLGHRDQVLQVVAAAAPDTVIHAAAFTDVDGCERDPDLAFRVNALGTRHVAEAARLVGSRVCYLSSDYVFSGASRQPYTEWDRPDPVSVYGRSKLGGERELGRDDTVIRTSWVCGRHGHNFMKAVLKRAVAGDSLRVVDDQHGCPTFADDLATKVRDLVAARLPGTFHVTNQGATTRYQFACDILEAAGFDPRLVSPIATAEMDPPRPAPRPLFSVLDNACLRLSGIPLLPDHHEPLQRLVPLLLDAVGAGPPPTASTMSMPSTTAILPTPSTPATPAQAVRETP